LKKKILACEFCRKEFSRAEHLNEHIRAHLGDKVFKCRLCDYATVQSGPLTRHMRTHTQERPYKCQEPDCKYSAKAPEILRIHSLVQFASTKLDINGI